MKTVKLTPIKSPTVCRKCKYHHSNCPLSCRDCKNYKVVLGIILCKCPTINFGEPCKDFERKVE